MTRQKVISNKRKRTVRELNRYKGQSSLGGQKPGTYLWTQGKPCINIHATITLFARHIKSSRERICVFRIFYVDLSAGQENQTTLPRKAPPPPSSQ